MKINFIGEIIIKDFSDNESFEISKNLTWVYQSFNIRVFLFIILKLYKFIIFSYKQQYIILIIEVKFSYLCSEEYRDLLLNKLEK